MVNINDVYQTVLTILNKEQRGYLDATEFSQLAVLVQREIVESYFSKFALAPNMGPTVADPAMFIDEKIAYFEQVSELSSTSESFFTWPTDILRLGVVTDNGIVVDSVSHKDIAYINLSPLTAPTEKQPVYVIHSNGIQVYPKETAGNTHTIEMVYIRVPVDPDLNYEFDEDHGVVFKDSKNFDLHPSEFQECVIRICAYAGVVVRAQEVTQFAQQKEQQITQVEQ